MVSHIDSDKEDKNSFSAREGFAIFVRLLGYVRPYLKRLALGFVVLLIGAIMTAVVPLIIRTSVDQIITENNTQLLDQVLLLLIGIFLFQSILNYIEHIVMAYVGESVVANLRKRLFDHLQSLSMSFYNNSRTGDIVTRITSDSSLVQQSISFELVQILNQIITIVIGLIVLFVLNWRLTAIILLAVPLIFGLTFFLGLRIQKAANRMQTNLAEAANVVEENIQGVQVVKSFAQQRYENQRFSGNVHNTFLAALGLARLYASMIALTGFLGFATISITLWYGTREVLLGQFTAGGVVAYLLLALSVVAAMGISVMSYGQIQSALGAARRIFDMIDIIPEITEHPDARQLAAVRGEVHLENVSHAYEPNTSVLRGITIHASPGQTIALVGPSGAGKSTLVNLIPRFYDVSEGAIRIDGHDIRNVTLESLNQQIGIVPQETFLFAQSIAGNIRYGKSDATQAEVEEAARAANAHNFIVNDLSDGYETLVGERGVKLSGGQRQRISIARAILKNPRILILDEATSSLDSESERLIQDALNRLMQGRTSFVIAHRLSTIVNADWIVVLNNGQIVEQGTHTDLVDRSEGFYQKLYKFQFALDQSSAA
ncbi:MAG: ABC transporter ATP-binding protein [Chloroflexi bacterium AL-W]|nr:ABC transporter ATP-binding protein [Chloroflexi bacterium AL-N1]NOK71652.1 ABC transporter ATP-binding protein [Chloroflexi bacterium AL-N10]NOK78952.1 ABC transporter ATP-binding protein [Chloroflexi bacterium AL-N5]NOK86427.1 ABC transporter ATP-binding protein [Chloroflexi bacterium AL-W]